MTSSARWATVFLDIDEVLCVDQPHAGTELLTLIRSGVDISRRTGTLVSPTARQALTHVHAQMCGRLRFVISSSWREHYSRSQLEMVFRLADLEFVADHLHDGAAWMSPVLTSAGPYQFWSAPNRLEEVELWLRWFHVGEPFVALDDEDSGGSLDIHRHDSASHLHGRVIICRPGVGLTMDHVDDILVALRRPA